MKQWHFPLTYIERPPVPAFTVGIVVIRHSASAATICFSCAFSAPGQIEVTVARRGLDSRHQLIARIGGMNVTTRKAAGRMDVAALEVGVEDSVGVNKEVALPIRGGGF